MARFELNCLPILVVSAKDQNSAEAIITEIIDKDEVGDNNSKCHVWRLINKYYTADVQLHTLLDGQELDSQLADSVEAHLIYMSEEECSASDATEVVGRRMRSVQAARAHVRVLAADAAEPPPALLAACAAARLELVPLRPAPPSSEDEPDERGVARVRAAFHAHVWPGLMRRGCDASTRVDSDESSRGSATDSSDSEWSEWCAAPGTLPDAAPGATFAAALGTLPDAAPGATFAAALGTLPGAAAAARAAGGARGERLARAEDVLAAFCRALAAPLD